jgi:ACS family tartrate transporter-like MFS transporter
MSSATAIPGVVVDQDDSDLARTTIRRVSLRLLPFLFLLFVCNYVDRTNIAIAALSMNRDLNFSASTYGLGSGIFFIGYALFEVPSNLILARVGARRWIARIMISWGVIASAMMFVRTPAQFYALRVLLGIAEAGFFPGIVYFLSEWFPAVQRGRALARFMIAVPLAGALGNPLSAWLLQLDGWYGLAGWQWVFLLEGIPSVVIGFSVLAVLTDNPAGARWLSEPQREWLIARLQRDGSESRAPHGVPPLRALMHPMVLLAAMLYFLAMTSHYGYLFWAPTIIRDELHASSANVGLITGGIACIAASVMLVVGASSDRTGERFVHAASCLALAALGYLGAALLADPTARVASLALVPAGVYGFLAPFWCLPSAILRGVAAAAGIAFINSFGNLGGFVGPYALGALRDATGSTTGALLGLSVMAFAAAALCFVLRRQAT